MKYCESARNVCHKHSGVAGGMCSSRTLHWLGFPPLCEGGMADDKISHAVRVVEGG
jgi:hypothetical protein